MTLFIVNHKSNDAYIVKNDVTKLSSEKFAMYIKGCAQNRRTSQKKIFKAFYEQAVDACSDYAVSPSEAVDIVNEGFLQIFTQIINHCPMYAKDVSSFTGWLRKTVLSVALQHYERANNHYIISAG